ASCCMDDPRLHLVGAELVQRRNDSFNRTLHVALDDEREFLQAARLQLRHHLLERTALASLACNRLLAGLAGPVLGDLAGTCFRIHHCETVARLRRALETQDLDRERRACCLDLLATVVDQGTYAAPLVAGSDDVARTQCTCLNQNRGNGAATAI